MFGEDVWISDGELLAQVLGAPFVSANGNPTIRPFFGYHIITLVSFSIRQLTDRFPQEVQFGCVRGEGGERQKIVLEKR